MPKTLFVGNLPYSMTEDSLKALFQVSGTVASVHIVLDRQTLRPKGFGVVEFEAPDAAAAAIAGFVGCRVGGRELVVNEARPREFLRGARY
jgi:RNA recognition motif-containing protein